MNMFMHAHNLKEDEYKALQQAVVSKAQADGIAIAYQWAKVEMMLEAGKQANEVIELISDEKPILTD